jgi:hypothetical protein
MRRWIVILTMTTTVTSPAGAQEALKRESSPPRSVAEFSAALRAEASNVDMAKYSKLFADLADVQTGEKLALSADQSKLVRNLNELTRDIIRAWLLRYLDAVPPPPATILAERLSDRGDGLRARLVAHAESIALEGILSPAQARQWRKVAGRRAQPLLIGSGGLRPTKVVDEGVSAEKLAAELDAMLPMYPRAGFVFSATLGKFSWPPSLVLPKQQEKLVRRLDELAVAVIRNWLTRGLDAKPLPPWSVLAERYSWSDRVVASLCAHAEAIALEGILTREQAEQTLAIVWKTMGLSALRSPGVASRLRLSTAQREELDRLLDRRARLPAETAGVLALTMQKMPDPVIGHNQAKIELENRMSATEEEIWNVLSPSQARILQRILGGPQTRQTGGSKRKSTRSD